MFITTKVAHESDDEIPAELSPSLDICIFLFYVSQREVFAQSEMSVRKKIEICKETFCQYRVLNGSPLQAKQNLHPTGVNFLPGGNKILPPSPPESFTISDVHQI